MKGLYYDGTKAVYREDLPVPVRKENQSLIRVLLSAVCSTDKEILKGYRPSFRGVMGHEFVGIVEESDDDFLIGKRVVGEINQVCHECLYCKTNREHHCSNRSTLGMSTDGCFAEYLVLNTENLHVVPDNLPTEIAVFTEPLAAAFEILEQIHIEEGTPVGLLGDGRLALCIANVMHLAGADLTVIGKHPDKLELFNSIAHTTTDLIPESYEIVIDATGSPAGISTAINLVRKKGTIVLKSTYADNASINLSLIPVNEITIVGSRCGPFIPALNALTEGTIVLPPIEEYDLCDYEKAFKSTAFKAGFKFDTPHKRRAHYSGKYPKKFEEKYKELQPDKYTDIADHVKSKGMTPAGTHISIMVPEILDFLDIKPGQKGLDCTFGYGGHSSKMIEKLEGNGHLVALDVDPIESAKSRERLQKMGFGEDILSVELTNFANIDEVVNKYGKFDFILADLGVSSMQIDNPERGFSYKVDGPLDLRLDPTHGVTAAERLNELSEDELIGLFMENSDEPYAEIIAKTIISFRKSGYNIDTTTAFRKVIEKALQSAPINKNEYKDTVKKSCARCFQALRIDINREMDVLYDLLSKLPDALNPSGRVAILTFHSGEDRLVKQSFKQFAREGIYSEVARDVIRPSAQECVDNPRSKSTKMRWAIKS